MPPIITARSRKSGYERTGMLTPGQSWTDFIPASRSMQTVWSGGRVFNSEVLPTPGGPKMQNEVLLLAAEARQ